MNKRLLGGLLACFFVMLVAGAAIAADPMTVTGVINDENQLVADDGMIYDIADTEQGAKLAENVGKKVTVVGAVEGSEDIKTITVESFTLAE